MALLRERKLSRFFAELFSHEGYAAVFIFVCFLFAVFSVRVLFLAARPNFQPAALSQSIQWIPRGAIFDRNGLPLALSNPSFSLVVDPLRFDAGFSEFLAPYLGEEPSALALEIDAERAKRDRYMLLLNTKPSAFVSQMSAEYARRFWLPKFTSFQEFNNRLYQDHAVWFEPKSSRYYGLGEASAGLVGLVSSEGDGQFGAEKLFDSTLKGGKKVFQVTRDSRGRVVEADPLALSGEKDSHDVSLSIDAVSQVLMHRALLSAVEKNNADDATAMLVDARTGEILAVDSLPSFDPNHRESLDVNRTAAMAFSEVYEPGSVMKPLVLAEAIDDLGYTLETAVPHSRVLSYGGRTVSDDFSGNAPLSAYQMIIRSSNVSISHVAMQLKQKGMARLFRKIGIDYPAASFPGASAGITPSVSARPDWISAAYGYAVALSTAHLVGIYQAIANNGIRLPLRITPPQKDEHLKGERLFTEKSSRLTRKALLGVVDSTLGTGMRAGILGYDVGGKTGTARRILNGAYDQNSLRALFVGMAPIDHPRFVLLVSIDTKKAVGGGYAAAPVFSDIMGKVLVRYGYYPKGGSL